MFLAGRKPLNRCGAGLHDLDAPGAMSAPTKSHPRGSCRACKRIYERAYEKAYRQTEKGKSSHRLANRRYNQTAKRRAWLEAYNRSDKHMASSRASRFGLPLGVVEALLAGGKCDICGATNLAGRKLNLDHDHHGPCGHTGDKACFRCFRGVLCPSDNNRLRCRHDRPWDAASAAYLEAHTARSQASRLTSLPSAGPLEPDQGPETEER